MKKQLNWFYSERTTILFAGFLLIIHLRLYQYAFDDAYIHFRIARNLVEIGKPYFNVNEMVKVSTSSGWTIFLAGIYSLARLIRIDNRFPLIIAIGNTCITLGGMIVYSKISEIIIGKKLSKVQKILFQIPFMALLIPSSVGLMETPFALLVMGLGIYFLLSGKPGGFIFIGFAVWIRVELIIITLLIMLFFIIQKRFRLIQIIGNLAIGAVPLFFYDLFFFHTIIPQSMLAKPIVYSIPWTKTFNDVLLKSLPSFPFHANFVDYLVGIIMIAIVIIPMIMAFKEREVFGSIWLLLFSLWGLIVLSGYILSRALLFDWYVAIYMLPVLLSSFICAFAADYPGRIILKSIFFALFFFSVFSLSGLVFASAKHPGSFTNFESGARVKMYLKVGAFLNDEYPEATLLTSEIGGLGYSFKGKIFDADGLASPDALTWHPMKFPEERPDGTVGAIPPGYVKEIMPDIIVSFDVFAGALNKDDLLSQYHKILIPAYLPEDAIYTNKKTIWSSKYLRVYIRKDLPVPGKIYGLTQ